jgi:protoporphyrinogen oxidase
MADSAVIGAGVLGLAIAHRLKARGDNVTVFEASPNLGGLASAWQLGDVTWDRHYHVTLASDANTRAMLRAIGLEDELTWVQTQSGFYAGPEVGLRPFSDAVDFLRLPTLNLLDKGRLGATILAGARQPDGEKMEQIPVQDWLTKWSGKRTFERFWLPLLRAKLGDEWRYASAAFIWATIQRLYAARRSGLKVEQFGYVQGGGYARIFDVFERHLTSAGVKINAGVAVREVREVPEAESADGGHRLELLMDDGAARFDNVVVTTASHLAGDLCPGLTDAEQDRLRAVRYMGVICASLLLPEKLSPYYLTYLTDPASPFTAVVEMTSFVDPAEVGGWTLVYLPKYTPPDDPLFDADDSAVQAEFLPYLQGLHPQVRAEDVAAFRVSRVRRVFAVPTLGYSASMPPTTTSIPGLQLIGSANLPFATLNVNDTLSLVEKLR